MGAKLIQSCLTIFDPMYCSMPGSSVHGISQATIPEWMAIFFLQGNFPTQGSNSQLLHWQVDSLPLSHLGSPTLLYRRNNYNIVNQLFSSVQLSCSVVSEEVNPIASESALRRYSLIQATSVELQLSSVTQSCPTLCDPMNRSTPGLPVHHHLPVFTQTHVH